MVDLVGAEPDPPEAGDEFRIKAKGGVEPYTFTWRVGMGSVERITQGGKVLTFSVQPGTSGEFLQITVQDGMGEDKAAGFTIIDPIQD